jgi:nitrate/nitrite transporter NarK
LPASRRTEIAHPARTAAFIYGGISVAGAVGFFLVTTFVAGYPAVARYGGAAWIFLLMMIVLMPIVIPQVQKRAKKRPGLPGPGSGDQASESGACPME